MSEDCYGEEGCCLTCDEAEEDCLCYACKCRCCEWYEAFDYEDERGRTGHCTHPSTGPPEGYVEMKVDEASDLVTVTIHPYFEPEDFDYIVQLLKENYFRFNPDKTWQRKIWSKENICLLREALKEQGISVRP